MQSTNSYTTVQYSTVQYSSFQYDGKRMDGTESRSLYTNPDFADQGQCVKIIFQVQSVWLMHYR